MSSQAIPDTLLALAEHLLAEGGPGALTMDALAKASGLSRATVYRQVGSREALLAALENKGIDVGDRDDIPNRILRAAEVVFVRDGFDGGTMEAIAAQAGLGIATLYRHFGDRNGLMKAFAAHHSPRRIAWNLARAQKGDLQATLTTFATELLTFSETHGPLLRLALMERARGNQLLAELAGGPDRTIHALTQILNQHKDSLSDNDPALLARAFLGQLLAFGPMAELLGLEQAGPPEKIAEFLVQTFLSGVRGKKTKGRTS